MRWQAELWYWFLVRYDEISVRVNHVDVRTERAILLRPARAEHPAGAGRGSVLGL